MSRRYDSDHILKLLKAEVAASSRAEVARRLRFTRVYISKIVSGEKGISAAIAECYDFERQEKPAQVYFTKKARKA